MPLARSVSLIRPDERPRLITIGGATPRVVNASAVRTRRLTRFDLFGYLPREVQDQIWETALPEESRIIPLSAQRICFSDDYGYPQFKVKLHNKVDVPALLQVNRASRRVASKYYSLQFVEMLGGKSIYIRFDQDIVALQNNAALNAAFDYHFISEARKEERKDIIAKVQNLVLAYPYTPRAVGVVAKFKNLKVLKVTPSYSRYPLWNGLGFFNSGSGFPVFADFTEQELKVRIAQALKRAGLKKEEMQELGLVQPADLVRFQGVTDFVRHLLTPYEVSYETIEWETPRPRAGKLTILKAKLKNCRFYRFF